MIEQLIQVISKLPPDALSGLGRMFSAMLSGKPDKAANEARVAAETIAAKQTIRAGYRARGK